MDFRVPFSSDAFLHTGSSPNRWPLVEVWVELVRHQVPGTRVTEHLSDQTGLPHSYKVACSPAQKWRRTKTAQGRWDLPALSVVTSSVIMQKHFLVPLSNWSLISVQVGNQIFVLMGANIWISVAICFLVKWDQEQGSLPKA